MKTLSVWISGLLFISLTGAHGLDHFPENFVVAKMDKPATLTCGTETSKDIKWKLNGEEVSFNGPNLNLLEVDTPDLGEYTCWRGEELISSTYLLLEAVEEQKLRNEQEEPLINCWAKSYDCFFSCKWTRSGYTAVRLGLGHDCSEGEKSCQWVSNRSTGGFQFELSHYLSPYAEESTMLEVTAEALINLSILRITKRFYLRDIVQPDSPQIVKCEEVEQGLNVTIDPPSSWSTPHSFFKLEHEIEYVLKDNGETGRASSAFIPKGISKVRARSRDSLVLSGWSQWTPWKNVRIGGKNLCKCKHTAKYCCPELPSGYLDKCKKKRKTRRNKDAKWNQTSHESGVMLVYKSFI